MDSYIAVVVARPNALNFSRKECGLSRTIFLRHLLFLTLYRKPAVLMTGKCTRFLIWVHAWKFIQPKNKRSISSQLQVDMVWKRELLAEWSPLPVDHY